MADAKPLQPPANGTCPFLALPPELRLEIYTHAMFSDPSTFTVAHSIETTMNPLAFLRTCRQIHAEVSAESLKPPTLNHINHTFHLEIFPEYPETYLETAQKAKERLLAVRNLNNLAFQQLIPGPVPLRMRSITIDLGDIYESVKHTFEDLQTPLRSLHKSTQSFTLIFRPVFGSDSDFGKLISTLWTLNLSVAPGIVAARMDEFVKEFDDKLGSLPLDVSGMIPSIRESNSRTKKRLLKIFFTMWAVKNGYWP